MSKYELISLVISIIAIIIPFVQWIWKVIFQKPKIKYYPNGKAKLFFNQSGSYLRINGVIEAINQPVSIKKIEVSVLRKSDSKTMNLTWSSFISPMVQSFIGNYSQSAETAHPFRIDKDSIACAFTEFSDESNCSWKRINLNTKDLYDSIQAIKQANPNYEDGLNVYKNSSLYLTTKQNISKEFFWEISKYDLKIVISYLNKAKEYKYKIEVNTNDNISLTQNIDELLLYPLKKEYSINPFFNTIEVELEEIN